MDLTLVLVAILGCCALDLGIWMSLSTAAEQFGYVDDWRKLIAPGFRMKLLLPRYALIMAFGVFSLSAKSLINDNSQFFIYISIAILIIYLVVTGAIAFRTFKDYVKASRNFSKYDN
jgi:hypothetical protein